MIEGIKYYVGGLCNDSFIHVNKNIRVIYLLEQGHTDTGRQVHVVKWIECPSTEQRVRGSTSVEPQSDNKNRSQ